MVFDGVGDVDLDAAFDVSGDSDVNAQVKGGVKVHVAVKDQDHVNVNVNVNVSCQPP